MINIERLYQALQASSGQQAPLGAAQQLGLNVGEAVLGSMFPSLAPMIRLGRRALAEHLRQTGEVGGLAAVNGSPQEQLSALAVRRWRQFWTEIRDMPDGAILIAGRKGYGKTAASLAVAELLGVPTYVLGIPQDRLDTLGWSRIPVRELPLRAVPQFVRQVSQATVLIDDAGTLIGRYSGQSVEAQALETLWMLLRHRGVRMIINSQSAALVERHIVQADVLLLKPPSLLYKDAERPAMQKHFQQAEQQFKLLDPATRPGWCYAVNDSYAGLVPCVLPTGWSDAISRNKGVRQRLWEPPENDEADPEVVDVELVKPADDRRDRS